MINAHITEYLDYYISLPNVPNYAILLRGKWGSGKTWFIKDYIKTHSNSKFLYVTLNGMTKPKEVEDEFFRQLHPALASKTAKFAGKIIKSFLKTAIKVDIDGDNKDDGTISSQIPDIDFSEFFKNAEGCILIFDDLERCAIPIAQILGYINQFVEYYGLKVIVVVNEDEIKERDVFLVTKEKLIGRSFTVTSDVDLALKEFMSLLSESDVKVFLNNKLPALKELYQNAGYNNLRHVQQSILEFDKFYNFLPDRVIGAVEILDKVFKIFFAISFELKKGNIAEKDIPNFLQVNFRPKEDSALSLIDDLKSKYEVFQFLPYPIDPKLWQNFFELSKVDKMEIENSIKNTYFKNETTPDFIKLWNQYDLEEDEFKKVLDSVLTKFKAGIIANKYELVHVVGLLFDLSKRKMIPNRISDIIKMSKKNIEFLIEKNSLFIGEHEDFPGHASFGYGYNGVGTPEMLDFTKLILEKSEETKDKVYKGKASELLAVFQRSVYNFMEQLTLTNSPNNLYYNIPILKFINPKDFVIAYLNHSNTDKKHFGWRFDVRYKRDMFNEQLVSELDWLVKVRKKIITERNKIKGTITYDVIDFFIKSLEKSIDILELTEIEINSRLKPL